MLELQVECFWLTGPGHGSSHSHTEYKGEKYSFSDLELNIILFPAKHYLNVAAQLFRGYLMT